LNAPDWVLALPTLNAGLNGLATVLLVAGYTLIKCRKRKAHEYVMYAAFGASILFLASYLTYHFALDYYTGESSKKFAGTGTVRTVYLGILLTHVVLAAIVPFLALTTIWRGWTQQWEKHARIAKITFPIWLYVSVTGVIIYFMLYHWAPA
jgi:protein SCO1/2/putative membrane protein